MTATIPAPAPVPARHALAFGALVLAAAACSPPVEVNATAVEAVARAAVRREPEELAGLRAEMERELAAARTARRLDAGRWWPVGGEAADVALYRAAGLALAHARGARDLETARRAEWLAAEASAEAARARAASAHRSLGALAPPGLLLLAGHHLEAARGLAEAGRYDEATAGAVRSSELSLAVQEAWNRTYGRFADGAAQRLWSRWVAETLAESRRSGRPVIVVDKLRRRVEVWEGGTRRAAFAAELGARGLERKLHAGDLATPEGRYRVLEVRTGGATRYHKALLLDYPSAADRGRLLAAQRRGEAPPGSSPGGLIELHGHGGQGRDWTEGCVALADEDMDALVSFARVGTPVTIVGTVP